MGDSNLCHPRSHFEVEKQYMDKSGEIKDALSIDNEMKCRDIEVGTTNLLEEDPTVKVRIMTGIKEQSSKYSKLSSYMGRILAELTKFKQDAPALAAAAEKEKGPKIIKEPCPDLLTKDTNPIEFQKFQQDFVVYYKELHVERASPEGQRHYLLKCPIFDKRGDPTKSYMAHLKEEFNRRFPVTNGRKDFFLQSQGTQQFTANVDKLRNMAVKADLSNATAKDLIVIMES